MWCREVGQFFVPMESYPGDAVRCVVTKPYTFVGLITLAVSVIFVTPVGAQTDSVRLKLRFHGAIDCTFRTQFTDTSGRTRNYSGRSSTFEYRLDSAVRVKNGDTIFGLFSNHVSYIEFSIDTVASELRDVHVYFDGRDPSDDVYMRYNAYFGSLPYSMEASSLVVTPTLYRDSIVADAMVSVQTDSGTEFGAWSKRTISTDSIGIVITSAVGSVAVHEPSPEASLLRVDFTSFTILFPRLNKVESLVLCDAAGRVIEAFPVLPQTESIPLRTALAPGLYFARLGDQVAKFVVPGR